MADIDYSIKEVEKVVTLDGEVKNVNVSRLTGPGENYLSLVLRVDFEVEKNGDSKTISTVAKRLPLGQRQAMFFHASAMKNEIRWYAEIISLLKNFSEEYSITLDFFPEHYGSRFSLDSSKKEPDEDSVLLLENLIPQGYQNDDRYIGCDLITSKAILKSLALFHAIPIAMKIKKPELFAVLKNFLDNSKPVPPGENGPHGPDGPDKKPFGPPPGEKHPEEIVFEALQNMPEMAPFLDKIKPLIEKPKGPESFHKLTEEPWNTVSHNDFWVNNIMVNHREGKEPLVKIVDFQMDTYGSYAKDVVFFLLTSVRNDVVKESMDNLLRYYHEEFTTTLKKTRTYLELPYEDFLKEVQKTANESEVGHALFFSTIIFGEKGTGIDAAVEEFDPFKHFPEMIKKMNQHQKDKLVVMASESAKRNWI